jgi:asparagine synthase (glutamine-hydrolysing)
MCGICGIFNPSGLDDTDRQAIGPMTQVLAHRGPDHSATRLDEFTALGHTRLSIVDIEGGAQPMDNEDGTVRTVFNGEIYNFDGLRNDLLKRGHEFKSRSDTEVLVHAYETYGYDFVYKLRGMFAFAVWDAANRRLIVARDRVGKKPLYYTRAQGRFLFASEIKSLLMHPAVRRRLDAHSLHHMLSFQNVPGQDTIFYDIKKLPPAHYKVIGVGDDNPHPYWSAADIQVEKFYQAREETGRLQKVIRDSVQRRLMGDVPVGAFLSGGVDSSAVVGLMSMLTDQPVQTFSIGFDDPAYDETNYASLVAKHFRTKHTEFKVTSQELMECMPLLVWHCDEPVPDSSILPTYCLSRLTREHVKVALSGDGGDELFGGYERYAADRYLHMYNYIPEGVRRNLLVPAFSMASHSVTESLTRKRMEQMAHFSPMSDAERHLNWLSFFTAHEKNSLYTPELAAELAGYNSADVLQYYYDRFDSNNRSFTDQQLLIDFLTYLPETLMMKVDRASMAVGLEVRCPLLSKEVVELALATPASLKIKGATTKRLLKQTFWNFLPAEILYRRKQGFEAPLNSWFRGPLREVLWDHLTDDRAKSRGLFNQNTVSRLLNEHQNGVRDHGHKLWILLNIEFWHRIFMDGPPPQTSPSLA